MKHASVGLQRSRRGGLRSLTLCWLLLALAQTAVAAEPAADVEEARLAQWPAAELPVWRAELGTFSAALMVSHDEAALLNLAATTGAMLWQKAVRSVQQAAPFDDRPLYWTRLAGQQLLRERAATLALPSTTSQRLWQAFEDASRGLTDQAYPETGERVFLTGFDPFRLDNDRRQSNPSGLAALALDGKVLVLGARRIQIETVLIPVRFADFDQGLIERVLTPVLTDPQMRLVSTISMGRSGFDLERFPGRRRSADAFDNRNIKTGGTAMQPVLPRWQGSALDGPEFVEFSLPADKMRQVQQPFSVTDNGQVTTLAGAMTARTLAQLQFHTAVNGSGGGYLSNEISYRSIRLRDALGVTLPVGHIHTPAVRGYDAKTERQIVEQIEAMLRAALQ